MNGYTWTRPEPGQPWDTLLCTDFDLDGIEYSQEWPGCQRAPMISIEPDHHRSHRAHMRCDLPAPTDDELEAWVRDGAIPTPKKEKQHGQ